MTAIRRRRLPRTARGLLDEAGPPATWQAAAIVVGTLIATVVAGVPGIGLVIPAGIVVSIACLPAILDVTGWRIRLAMAWLVAEQRRRGSGGMPRSVAAADRWLSEHPDASPLWRSGILVTAGRIPEARATIEAMTPKTDEDRAVVARMLAAIDGLRDGAVDPRAAIAAIELLPPAQQTYHRLSLAWATAWVEKTHGRPWRSAFAAAGHGLDVRAIPTRWLVLLSVYHLLLPICVTLVLAFWALIILTR